MVTGDLEAVSAAPFPAIQEPVLTLLSIRLSLCGVCQALDPVSFLFLDMVASV